MSLQDDFSKVKAGMKHLPLHEAGETRLAFDRIEIHILNQDDTITRLTDKVELATRLADILEEMRS